jgi:hypothetical protein
MRRVWNNNKKKSIRKANIKSVLKYIVRDSHYDDHGNVMIEVM